MVEIRSRCFDDYRWVELIEGPTCTMVVGQQYMVWMEPCSYTEELINTWPVFIGLSVILGILFCCLFIFSCFCKAKRRYQRLIEYRASNQV